MTWHAKPNAFPFWDIDSEESFDNADEIYNMLSGTWTLTAICGMLGNMHSESGMNPWAWQSNTVTFKGGYGLVQFTPARSYTKEDGTISYGYLPNLVEGLEGFGEQYEGYAPNFSVTEQTTGANASDGHAQILAVDANAGGKYSSSGRSCYYADLSSVKTFEQYKQCDDLWIACCGWLIYYEAPKEKGYEVAVSRFSRCEKFWKHFTEDPPKPPEPPYPKRQSEMPLWMYLRKV